MNRRVIASEHQAATARGQEIDTFFDRVVKYIPAEIVSAWVAAKGLVESTTIPSKQMVLWICFVVGLALTALYSLKVTAVPGQQPAYRQTTIATIAFLVWVLALGEPFATLLGKTQQSLYGSLLLIAYTLIVALLVKNPDPAPASATA